MTDYEILITSVPDREKLVAEIWLSDEMIAEINQDGESLEIEFYPNNKIGNKYALDKFISKIIEAKEKLVPLKE
jgi:hypothetical protein